VSRFRNLEFPDDSKPKQQPVEEGTEKRYRHSAGDWLREADEKKRLGLHEEALRLYSRALENDRSLVPCWVEQVRMLVLLGEPRQADLWATSGLKLFPQNGDLLAGRAQAMCRMGNRKGATEYSDASLQSDGDSPYRWIARGEVMLAARSKSAQHCFDSAQQLSEDWLVRVDIANVLLYYHSPAAALQRVNDAVTLAPDKPYLWLVKGKCEYEAGFGKAAEKSIDNALQLLPDYQEAAILLAKIRNNSGFWSHLWKRLRKS